MMELSSFVASVTIKEFGFFFFFRIAVEVSSTSFFSAPEGSLQLVRCQHLPEGVYLLEVDLGLLLDMLRFTRHGEDLKFVVLAN